MFASTEPLAGRIAVITGASRGLGGVLARAVHAAGARVAALARPSLALEKFAAEHPEMLVARATSARRKTSGGPSTRWPRALGRRTYW